MCWRINRRRFAVCGQPHPLNHDPEPVLRTIQIRASTDVRISLRDIVDAEAPGILVLEDDSASRFVLKTVLEGAGFSVLESLDAASAVSYCAQPAHSIDLLIADVVLRGPHGPEALREIQELRPQMPILFISGYPLEQLANRRLIDSRIIAGDRADFLQKPFTAESLLYGVRKLLETA
jgi:two-component system, cell cycle sensor histidine kinase and response regulator CckA